MVTIVFDDANLQADAVMYLDKVNTPADHKIWRIWAEGTSFFNRVKGKKAEIYCSEVNSIDRKSVNRDRKSVNRQIPGLNEKAILEYAEIASFGLAKLSKTYQGSIFHGFNCYSFMGMLLQQGWEKPLPQDLSSNWVKVDVERCINGMLFSQTVKESAGSRLEQIWLGL